MFYQKCILLSFLGVSVAGAAHTGLRSSVSVVSNSEGSPSIKLGEALGEALGSEATPSTIPDNRNSDRSCDDPSSADESRSGDTYEFQREGERDRICIDSNDNEYDYGEIELDDDKNAEDCATACVKDPDEDTLEHLVGYNWNCKESLCHCLYENDDLTESEESSFDSFDDRNSGSGSVDGTESEDDWRCYKLDDGSSSSSSSSSNDNKSGNRSNSCNPSSVEQNRRGITYAFKRFRSSDQSDQSDQSDRVCTDSSDRKYDYGEEELDGSDEADDCATKCVNKPDRETLEHLVGFDWNCDQSRCRCLYENNTLSDVDKAVFDDFDSDNNGVGSVENTDNENDWRCYRLESTTQDIIASIA